MSSDNYGETPKEKGFIYIKTESDKQEDKKLHSSKMAVWRAFAANIGIAGIKFACYLLTKSSAMLSESIHSAVDSFNSLCLLVGIKRGSKPADKLHPFGYGLEANIWTLFASILMLGGTIVSFYSAFQRAFYHQGEVIELLENYHWIALTLIISILFELWAVVSASKAVAIESNIQTKNLFHTLIVSFKNIRKIKSPTTKFVWYEDTAALSGVVIAFIALSVSKFIVPMKYAYVPDAIASALIGLILFAMAIYLLRNNMTSLTGVAAGPQVETIIREVASNINGISQLHELKTIDMGASGLVINMTIEVDPETQVKDADDIAEMLERKIRRRIRNIAHITIEMQADDAEDNWEEKFEKLIKEGQNIGVLKPFEAQMLSKFFDFTDTVVREIMIPRTEVVFIDAEEDIHAVADLIVKSGHTRIPIYRDNTDNIVGVINAKDVLKALKENPNNGINIETLAREVQIIPENKSISDLLNDLTSSKGQLAAVVDEHGGVAGIVSLEDILEEIVGEIYDEFDVVEIPELIKVDEKTLSLAAKMGIYDINERFDLDLSTEDFQTIGGYVFGLIGREPEEGDEVSQGNLTFKVGSVDGRKITRVIMTKLDAFTDTFELPEEEQEEETNEL